MKPENEKTFPVFDNTEIRKVEGFRRSKNTAVLTVMFTDIQGYTAFTEKVGDIVSSRLRHIHDELFLQTISEDHAGEVIKQIGDSFLAVFAEPSTAIAKANEFLHKLDEHKNDLTVGDYTLRVRIGLNMGQVSHENALSPDIFGRHVNLASRIMSLAKGGQLLASQSVYDSAAGWLKNVDLPIEVLNCGKVSVKGFSEKVVVYEFYDSGKKPYGLKWQATMRRVKAVGAAVLIASIVFALHAFLPNKYVISANGERLLIKNFANITYKTFTLENPYSPNDADVLKLVTKDKNFVVVAKNTPDAKMSKATVTIYDETGKVQYIDTLRNNCLWKNEMSDMQVYHVTEILVCDSDVDGNDELYYGAGIDGWFPFALKFAEYDMRDKAFHGACWYNAGGGEFKIVAPKTAIFLGTNTNLNWCMVITKLDFSKGIGVAAAPIWTKEGGIDALREDYYRVIDDFEECDSFTITDSVVMLYSKGESAKFDALGNRFTDKRLSTSEAAVAANKRAKVLAKLFDVYNFVRKNRFCDAQTALRVLDTMSGDFPERTVIAGSVRAVFNAKVLAELASGNMANGNVDFDVENYIDESCDLVETFNNHENYLATLFSLLGFVGRCDDVEKVFGAYSKRSVVNVMWTVELSYGLAAIRCGNYARAEEMAKNMSKHFARDEVLGEIALLRGEFVRAESLFANAPDIKWRHERMLSKLALWRGDDKYITQNISDAKLDSLKLKSFAPLYFVRTGKYTIALKDAEAQITSFGNSDGAKRNELQELYCAKILSLLELDNRKDAEKTCKKFATFANPCAKNTIISKYPTMAKFFGH